MSALPESPDLSETRLQEIEARSEKASGGPWFIDQRISEVEEVIDGWEIACRPGDGITERLLIVEGAPDYAEPDAEFIAHARQDIPDLLAEVRRLQSALTAARALESAASSALLAFETPAVTEVGQREQREAWNALGEAIAEFRSRPLEGQRDAE